MGLLDELLMAQTKKRNLMMQGTSPRVDGQLTQMVARPSQSPLREQFPIVYGALGGLLGMEPDSMEGSILDPNTAAVRQGAGYGYPAGLALQALPMAAPAVSGAKAVGKFVAPKAGQLAENYMQRMGMMPGIVSKEGGGLLTPIKNIAPQQATLDIAQQNAAKAGQSLDAYPRSLQQGYEYDWYHGSTGDIKSFNPSLLGEATGAASAKKGFFFARDPQNPPASMMVKSTDPESINFLKKLGKTDEEIAALNAVSMQGHGAETASGYAQIGGSREYRDATRKASAAEKRGDWDEYEKQAQIAEDSEIKRMNYAQDLTAKYGDSRDEMLSSINESIYSKNLGQAEAEALDTKVKELMPYGWYNQYDNKQFDNLKNQITKLVGKDAAAPALKEIDRFKSIKNERALIDKTQQGGNVMPVALRYQKPLVYDFEGKAYREQTYSDLIDQALAGGNDALILKNTFDPGGGPAKLVDVGVVFSPDQIRSRFAAFDPLRKTAAIAAAAGVAAPDLLAADFNEEELRKQMQSYGLLY
jgi:hypothetical protein